MGFKSIFFVQNKSALFASDRLLLYFHDLIYGLLMTFVAFILYRQHYQAQVVAQNPGLANPEISKIIGEQWREQPAEVKNDWKRLAEVRPSRATV
jgi:hypothetical protein